MKRILVTGSNGLLGQKITENILSTSRAELIATSKGNNRFPVQEGYIYVPMDISSKENMQAVIAEFKPDVIINTAAVTNVDVAENNKELCWKLNVQAVKDLIEICTSLDIHLIHLSTDFVFDGEHGPYSEEDEPNPLSYYGKSKYEAEQLLQSSACRWTIIRTILVYGILPDLSRSNIITWAKSALGKGSPINVVNDQWRMPTLAEDLAEACLLAAEKGATGIFNVSGKDMMSILELVEKVEDFWGFNKSLINPISSESLNQAARRPRKTGFILDKAIRELGYQPHSFQEGMEIVAFSC
jgi:dTDP-4-dehydrorhamnose reductase